jgi:hypothetical protein
MAASLKETGPTCSVLLLTFNKCDLLKETKSSTILYNKYKMKLPWYQRMKDTTFFWIKMKIKGGPFFIQ